MNVQREAVECHGADESYTCGHGVHYLEVPVEPQPLQLGENVERLKLFQVEDLRVREPELLDEGHVHGDPGVCLVFRSQVLLNFLLKINIK